MEVKAKWKLYAFNLEETTSIGLFRYTWREKLRFYCSNAWSQTQDCGILKKFFRKKYTHTYCTLPLIKSYCSLNIYLLEKDEHVNYMKAEFDSISVFCKVNAIKSHPFSQHGEYFHLPHLNNLTKKPKGLISFWFFSICTSVPPLSPFS